MNKKYVLLIMSLFSLFPSVYAADNTVITLDYVRNVGDGAYRLYGKNIPTDLNLLNIYIDNKKVDRSSVNILKEGIDVRNYFQKAGTFAIERLKTVNTEGSSAVTYTTDMTTPGIRIYTSEEIGFNGQMVRGTSNGYDIITLPFINDIPANSPFSQLDLQIVRELYVNGAEKNVLPFASEYKDGEYYFSSKGITFIEKNLTDRVSHISFKIDGLSSNYVTVTKEGIALDNVSQITIEDGVNTKNLKFTFSQPKNFTSMVGKEVYVNGAVLPEAQVTVGLGQLVIRYDMSKLPKDQDTLTIMLRDTATNQFSNEQIISVGKFSKLLITEIDTGKGNTASFTFVIRGNINALFGDIYKFKVNINGTDYTKEGVQEVMKDASGATLKDSNGADRYQTKNKIDFRKTGAGIEFDFAYKGLNDGENVVYMKNDNSGRESNMVSFRKGNNSSVNYNYLTGATLTENIKKETMTFDIAKDFEKNLNPAIMSAGDRDINFGNLKLSNLKNNEYYKLSFTVDANLAKNPFAKISLDTTSLEANYDLGKTTYTFEKKGFGKDLKTDMALIGVLNELFNVSDKAITPTIKEISLQQLTGDNAYESVISIKNPLKANLFYSYAGTKCFDGTKDFCSITKEGDPALVIRYSASGAPVTIEKPASTVSTPATSETGTVVKSTKKNVTVIVLQTFSNAKFTKVQDILVKKYEELKKKGSIYVPTFRKATNSILLALKNYELKKDVAESIAQVKSSLKTLNEVLKQAKKE